MRAVLVSVNYHDILMHTLPWNRHHFTDVMVVTSERKEDDPTFEIAQANECHVWRTNIFWERGAKFNKWAALEEALDMFGRKPVFPTSPYAESKGYLTSASLEATLTPTLEDSRQEHPTLEDSRQQEPPVPEVHTPHLDHWMCLMDADILWPRDLRIGQSTNYLTFNGRNRESTLVKKGMLCSPFRRMFTDTSQHFLHPRPISSILDITHQVNTKDDQDIRPYPPESLWHNFQVHRNVGEWAGYSQIFHLEDPMLPTPPWHDTSWTHCGGADSFFQERWPKHLKVRPFWECLHIGNAGLNWMGRATHYLGGVKNPDHDRKREEIMAMWRERRRREKLYRGNQQEIFRPEKLE